MRRTGILKEVYTKAFLSSFVSRYHLHTCLTLLKSNIPLMNLKHSPFTQNEGTKLRLGKRRGVQVGSVPISKFETVIRLSVSRDVRLTRLISGFDLGWHNTATLSGAFAACANVNIFCITVPTHNAAWLAGLLKSHC